jgi:hypothetical protein
MSVCVIALGLPAQEAVTISTGRSGPHQRVGTFLEETIRSIRAYHTNRSLNARVSMRRRTAGLTQTVNADCQVTYLAPDYLAMDVKGLYPYTVIVSNGTVTTRLPEFGDEDVRPLAEGERILDDFLGISALTNDAAYVFHFEVEGDLQIVSAEMRPEQHAALLDDVLANARRAVRRQIWVDPRRSVVVRTHTVTLAGDDTTLRFREQWHDNTRTEELE